MIWVDFPFRSRQQHWRTGYLRVHTNSATPYCTLCNHIAQCEHSELIKTETTNTAKLLSNKAAYCTGVFLKQIYTPRTINCVLLAGFHCVLCARRGFSGLLVTNLLSVPCLCFYWHKALNCLWSSSRCRSLLVIKSELESNEPSLSSTNTKLTNCRDMWCWRAYYDECSGGTVFADALIAAN